MVKLTTIYLVEDHALLREGIKYLLAREKGWCILGESADGAEALCEINRLKPDIVILDLKLVGMGGEEILRELRKQPRHPKILVLSQLENPRVCRQIIEIGADAVVAKSGASEQILVALESIRNGETYLGPEAADLLNSPCNTIFDLVTERERQIVKLLTEGKTNKEIASHLGCSDQTVKTHKANLMRKFGFSNSAEVSAWAVRVGLL